MDQSDAEWYAEVRHGHPSGPFGHREHLRLAWLALRNTSSRQEAEQTVSEIVRRLAQRHGAPQRYNRTVTDAWVRIVAHFDDDGHPETFDDLISGHPALLDKRLLMRHYTSRTLASRQARQTWVDPDLLPIPS